MQLAGYGNEAGMKKHGQQNHTDLPMIAK